MQRRDGVSRRGFVGGVAAAVGTLGYAGLRPASALWAQRVEAARATGSEDEYDALAKLSFNENPAGPSDAVIRAMTRAFKYAPRYGYPDGDIVDAIAKHHGVKAENILLGAGSGEILNVMASTFLEGGKKVVGVEPTFSAVYEFASGMRADAIRLPLLEDYTQDIPTMTKVTRRNYRDIGFVYLCNPNNPTGRIVPAAEVRQLLDGIPEDMPVLIDEAYHHYVEDPAYATSVPYVLEGRPVIVARTFSKIYGMAGMRLGYAIAPREIVRRMNARMTGTVNAVVKWGGVAALEDKASEAKVRAQTLALRKQAVAGLESLGYQSIPSEGNFFMVHLRRPIQPVIEGFRKQGVLVGRPFPPMVEHLRVSVGTPQEMERFMTAFKSVVPQARTARAG